MPLRHLLYRCPCCGHDPTSGEGDGAACAGCGASFRRVPPGCHVRVVEPSGAARVVHPRALVRRVREAGGPRTAARKADGTVRYEARVMCSEALSFRPVRRAGRLLGFFESQGRERPGTVVAGREGLSFEAVGGGAGRHWSFLDITGIQVSSSALQIKPRGAVLVQLRFPDDSPLRWEELVQWLMREAYTEHGRGLVVEFQPRVVVA
ncbi:MAG TPA: hypothetical protein VGA70_10160 [Longimicrobiales bacterium]